MIIIIICSHVPASVRSSRLQPWHGCNAQWYLAPESFLVWYFQTCVDQYRALVDSWKEGDLSTHMPMNNGSLLPIGVDHSTIDSETPICDAQLTLNDARAGALLAIFNWCLDQGKQRQQELIGQNVSLIAAFVPALNPDCCCGRHDDS
eukprot:SAG31_NODE_81_length_27131_cov_4.775283_5_plen_148_part_00